MGKIIVILFVFSVCSFSQVSAGFTLEMSGVNTDNYFYLSNAIPTRFGILLGYSPLEKLSAELRMNYDYYPYEYRGVDYSVFVLYKFYPPFYVAVDFTHHSNEAIAKEGVPYAKANLMGGGLGIELSSVISVEIIYDVALSKEIWKYARQDKFDLEGYQYWDVRTDRITGVAYLNLKFAWDF